MFKVPDLEQHLHKLAAYFPVDRVFYTGEAAPILFPGTAPEHGYKLRFSGAP